MNHHLPNPLVLPRPPKFESEVEREMAANDDSTWATLSPNGNTPEVLIAALKDSDACVRRWAAEALGRIGAAEAVPALIDVLDPNMRRVAAWALGNIGPAARDAVPALVRSLRDPECAAQAAEALGKIGAVEAVPALIHALESIDHGERDYAAYALGVFGPAAKDAVPALIRRLRDPDPTCAGSASGALGKIGAAAVPAILVALKDPDACVRRQAANALGEMWPAPTDAVPALLVALRDPEVHLRRSAARALGHIGAAEAVPALLVALKDRDVDVRRSAVWALSPLCYDAARDVILPAIDRISRKDRDWRVRQAASKELRELGQEVDAVPALLLDLKDRDVYVRRSALRALQSYIKGGALGPAARDVVLALKQISRKDRDESVREAASEVLEELRQD